MPQTNNLEVEVYPADEAVEEPLRFSGVHYISLVVDNTWGIPAIISDREVKSQGLPLRVLYVNPGNIAAMHVERTH